MAKAKNWGTATQRHKRRAAAYRPIANELGWLIFEWNRLHQALADIFANLVSKTKDKSIPYAIWHSSTNDRPQREMLRAVVSINQVSKPRQYDDISWLLNLIDRDIAGIRNDAIHAPLIFVNEMTNIELIPAYFFGNPRARALKDKNLLEEFRWFRNRMAKLALFAEMLHYAIPLSSSDFLWPDRPELPTRDQYRTISTKRRRKQSK